jgi:hypothetical protein
MPKVVAALAMAQAPAVDAPLPRLLNLTPGWRKSEW